MNAFKFNVGTYPTLVMRSRAHREGVYAGKRSGQHYRLPINSIAQFSRESTFSMQVKALNRKQRKQASMSQGEM